MDQDDVTMEKLTESQQNTDSVDLIAQPLVSLIEQQPLVCLSPQSASKVGKIASTMTDFMTPLNDEQPKRRPFIEQMITFDMAVDEEISIPANGKCSQSQASIGNETFYTAASGSSSMEDAVKLSGSLESQDPMMMSIERNDIESAGQKAMLTTISKESMPDLVTEKAASLIDDGNFKNELIEPQVRRRSITDDDAMQDIDPTGLIAFDSPSRFTGLRPAASSGQLLQTGLSLLDVDIMASPASMAKYSQRDFDRLKGEFERRAERQAEFMQFEIQTLQERYDASLQANNELRILMGEYENTMAQILEARKQKSDQLATIEQLLQDKRQLQVDLQTAQVTYQNLHSRYEEVKSLNEQLRVHEQTLKANIASLQAELTNADRRYDALRQHAEQKLQEANSQIQRVQSSMDVELSATKAKLLKAELRIGSLEEAVASKTKENRELGAICDELIQKIDPSQAPAIQSGEASL